MDDEEDDESINVQSENFNPLVALYSKRLMVPFPSAPVLDNVAKANSLLSRNKNLDDKSVHPPKAIKLGEPSRALEIKEEEESSLSKGSDQRPQKNLLVQMSETTKGPLAFLRTCMEKRIRVKVWTRGAREIRGYCIGFVAAFDKHWNLALEDVQEVWKRKIKRKTYLLGTANVPPLGWRAMGPMVKPPKITVKSIGDGKETCERHVSQMLMRDFSLRNYRKAFDRREKENVRLGFFCEDPKNVTGPGGRTTADKAPRNANLIHEKSSRFREPGGADAKESRGRGGGRRGGRRGRRRRRRRFDGISLIQFLTTIRNQ